MAMQTLECKVSVAWWLIPYLRTLAAFCVLTGMEPDWKRLETMCLRAMTFRMVSK